ncbi:MAG: hypothetical protein J7527_05070 [Chitinophagaceae bacterium]|nr:hypothetical protein [Chitinophagaceae bacterium]
MAELEVIKHAKKVMTTVNDKESGWKHKLKEIVLEVLIIVFAVSLSISLHGWSEGRHDRHEEHEFLVGLKDDLQGDLSEMKDDSLSYARVVLGAAYFYKVSTGGPLNIDSLNQYSFMFYNATYLAANTSRFEGLKASGKLSIIRNKELLNSIIDLYEEHIPFVNMGNQWANNYKMSQLAPYIDQHLDITSGNNGLANWEEILRSNPIRNGLVRIADVSEVVGQYGVAMEKIRSILQEIDKELH